MTFCPRNVNDLWPVDRYGHRLKVAVPISIQA